MSGPRNELDPEAPEGRALARRERPRERAQLRAALALEEAGELQEAARMFEYVGEHAQAASLRLEHADTLRDESQRLTVLREGCARNPASSEQGRALHRALGETLVTIAEGLPPGTRRRALLLEAAAALVDGQKPTQGGRIYEHLGLLPQAAEAYTAGGAIARLEAIHVRLEAQEDRERARHEIEREIGLALEAGRRRQGHRLLTEHHAAAAREGRAPLPALAHALQELERRLVRTRALTLTVRPSAGPPTVVRVIGRPQLRMGRGPQCELSVGGPALSREHAELTLAAGELVLRDLGSRAGTFLDGQPLAPGDDWPLFEDHALDEAGRAGQAVPAELALGIATSFELAPRRLEVDPRPVALIRDSGLSGAEPRDLASAWTLFLPMGGPLWPTPDAPLPLRLRLDGEHVELLPDPQIRVTLDGVPLGAGVVIELLTHDRLRLSPPQGPEFEVEVAELRP